MKEGSNKNIKKNYLLNLIYQVFVIITPLVTTPYISRVLGSSGIGKYSFCYSLVSYFVIFASLGFNTYAQREIASFQGDSKKQSEVFWEIIFARFGSVALSLISFIVLIYLCKLDSTYTVLMKILSINILATAFDVTFFFQGNEAFGIIVLRNVVIKCIGIALIFIFVNGREDVWVYTLCQTIVLVVSNLSLWTRIPRVTEKIDLRELEIKRHYIPTLKLFIPTIAASVYTILDKTLIGILIPGTVVNAQGVVEKISDLENGYYEQAEKIVKMVLTVVTSLGTVMIPRNSNAIASGNMNEFKKNIQGAFVFVFFIGAPMAFGLSAISFNLCPWFFGDGFDKVPYLIILFSPLILIIGLSNVLGLQYLIPMRMDFQCAMAISSGAIINLILNILLIRKYLSYGACIASVGAELLVTCMMFYFARNQISFYDILRRVWKYIICSIIMFIIIYCTQQFLNPSIISTLILIIEGIIVYAFELVITKDKLVVSYLARIIKK